MTENLKQLSVQHILFERYYKSDARPKIDSNNTSSHWKEYSKKISVKSVVRKGTEDFDLKGYGFGENQDRNIISRIFSFFNEFVNLKTLHMAGLKKDIVQAKKLIKRMGLVFSQDAFRQVCSLNFIREKLKPVITPRKILIIGDGYGILSGLLHNEYPDACIYMIDLGPMLFFQSFYLNKLYPGTTQNIVDGSTTGNAVFNFCSADDIGNLADQQFDLAINIASMQEMDMQIVEKYFNLIRSCKTKFFYCCNRIEKKMPGGEISKFMEYPWKNSDHHVVDELCPWHQWFLGYGGSKNVIYRGIKIPFVYRYDGPHWHRLSLISK